MARHKHVMKHFTAVLISVFLATISIFMLQQLAINLSLFRVAAAPPIPLGNTITGLDSYTAPYYMPTTTSLPSDAWRPTIYRSCTSGMPREWAPCLNFSNLEIGEEIVYPDFKILLPRYVDPSHASLLVQSLSRKPHPNIRDKEHVHYLNQHGRNLVFRNTSYTGVPQATWVDDACMVTERVKVEVFARNQRTQLVNGVHDFVMFAASPDSYSFQHFMDRVAVMLIQSAHLRAPGIKYITLMPRYVDLCHCIPSRRHHTPHPGMLVWWKCGRF